MQIHVFWLFFFYALGMATSELYNHAKWKRYLQGMEHGVSMREWKENKSLGKSIYTRSKAGK